MDTCEKCKHHVNICGKIHGSNGLGSVEENIEQDGELTKTINEFDDLSSVGENIYPCDDCDDIMDTRKKLEHHEVNIDGKSMVLMAYVQLKKTLKKKVT